LIGYAPDSWDAVLRWGAKHKYSIEDLEACGLVVASDRPDARNKHYDRFRDRLMFPIHDGQGRVIGFSGRALKDEARGAKYVNSPETPLFRKSRVLYGLNRARRPIVEAREAILCEGQIDVIKCHMAGFDTAVAAQGTAFTEDHARALRHYADSVKLLFDADTAGQDAAMKTAGLLIAFEFEVTVVRMPPGHDPDSLIAEKGADALRAVLDCAGSSVAFQIEVLSERERERNAGGGGRMRVASAVLQTIARASKEVQKEQLLQEASERLNVSVAALRADMKSVKPVPLRAPQPEHAPQGRPAAQGEARQAQSAPAQRGAPQPPPRSAAVPRTELALCEFLAQLDNDAAVLAEVKRYLPFDVLNNVDCRRLATACVRSAESGEPVMSVLAEIGEISESLQQLATSVLGAPMKVKGESFSRTDAIRDIILDLWRRKLKHDRAALHAIPDTEISKTDATRREQLTQDIIALRNWDEAVEAIELILEEQI
jgi:DNA primase